MSITERKLMYAKATVNTNTELDLIDTKLGSLDLETIRTFRIPQGMEYRPDLISMKVFGNFDMGWLIALHNDFLDPILDFYTGRTIKIPSLDEYYRFYNRNARSTEG